MTTKRTFIYFTNEGAQTKISVDTLLDVERYRHEFSLEQGNQINARLLAVHLRARLAEIMEEARREAYLDGYRDGRAKRGRKTWFSSLFSGEVK